MVVIAAMPLSCSANSFAKAREAARRSLYCLRASGVSLGFIFVFPVMINSDY